MSQSEPPAARPVPDIEDSETLAQLLVADESGFSRVVCAFQKPVFGFLSRMGFDAATTADLAQESFLRLWRFRENYDPARGSVAAWVFVIARNVALSEWQRGGRRPTNLSDPEALTDLVAVGDAEDGASLMQMRERLQIALQSLETADRATIALAYVDGLNSREAAELVGCKPGAFRRRLSRARQRLAARLENLYE